MLDIKEAINEMVEAARNIKKSGKFSREVLGKTFDAVDRLNSASQEDIMAAMSSLDGNDEMATLLTGVLLASAQSEHSKKAATTQTFAADSGEVEYTPTEY